MVEKSIKHDKKALELKVTTNYCFHLTKRSNKICHLQSQETTSDFKLTSSTSNMQNDSKIEH